MRMLGRTGNPQARNLFELLRHLQRAEGVRVTVAVRPESAVAVGSEPDIDLV